MSTVNNTKHCKNPQYPEKFSSKDVLLESSRRGDSSTHRYPSVQRALSSGAKKSLCPPRNCICVCAFIFCTDTHTVTVPIF